MENDKSTQKTRTTFQIFKSGQVQNHNEELLLPAGIEIEKTPTIQVNEEEALYPLGVKIEDD
ncbi:MAG: hypothetical protein ROO71_09955 [Balneola sp.]